MALAGGLRRKLIKASFHEMVKDSMTTLGWFSPTLQAKPVTLISNQFDVNKEIKPNVVGISMEDIDAEPMELGSTLEEVSWMAYLDIFAEDDSIGTHLYGDLYDILRGKIAGRTAPVFDVIDLTMPTPDVAFTCEILDIEGSRVRDWDRPYNKYWWVVGCRLVDTYM